MAAGQPSENWSWRKVKSFSLKQHFSPVSLLQNSPGPLLYTWLCRLWSLLCISLATQVPTPGFVLTFGFCSTESMVSWSIQLIKTYCLAIVEGWRRVLTMLINDNWQGLMWFPSHSLIWISQLKDHCRSSQNTSLSYPVSQAQQQKVCYDQWDTHSIPVVVHNARQLQIAMKW